MTAKYYELYLPFFKQGDDLDHYWDQAKTTLGVGSAADKKAMLVYANTLCSAADILCRVAACTEKGLSISDAMTHHIGIECEEELGDTLVKEGLLFKSRFDEEEMEEE